MDPLFGAAAISGISSLLGGAFRSITGNSSQQREYERQKEFAQNGISWRVADAERAGLHPLAAIGANVTSYTPQSVTGNDFGLESIGQNLESFIRNYKSPKERAHEAWERKTRSLLDLRQMELQNQKTQSEIDRNNAEIAALTIQNQPGHPLSYPAPQSSSGKVGDFDAFEKVAAYYSPSDKRVVTLAQHPDFAQLFEDIPLIEFTPTLVGFKADKFDGNYDHVSMAMPIRTIRGLIYSPLHKGWISENDTEYVNQLKKFLIDEQLSVNRQINNLKRYGQKPGII